MPILDTPPAPTLTTRPAWSWADYHAEYAGEPGLLAGCQCGPCVARRGGADVDSAEPEDRH